MKKKKIREKSQKIPEIISEDIKLIKIFTAIIERNLKKYGLPKDASFQEGIQQDLQEISKIFILIAYKQESYKGRK